jgi:hypothetical protein
MNAGKMPVKDHDILIEVKTILKEFRDEVRNFTHETQSTLKDFHSRIKVLEDDNLKYNLSEKLKTYDRTVGEWLGFKDKLKVWGTVFGLIYAAANALLVRWIWFHR